MTAFTSVMGVCSIFLGLAALLPYWRSILRGQTKPHQFSWLVFTIMNAIVTISQFLEGGRASVLISLTFFIGSMGNFLFSLRYGTRDSSRFDKALFALAMLTIVAWVATKDNAVAIWLTVLIDVFATAMIILKIATDPSSEAPWPWTIGTSAFIFSLLSLVNTSESILFIRPIYGLLSGGSVVGAILLWRHRATGWPAPDAA